MAISVIMILPVAKAPTRHSHAPLANPETQATAVILAITIAPTVTDHTTPTTSPSRIAFLEIVGIDYPRTMY
jgi:hypothetical protein